MTTDAETKDLMVRAAIAWVAPATDAGNPAELVFRGVKYRSRPLTAADHEALRDMLTDSESLFAIGKPQNGAERELARMLNESLTTRAAEHFPQMLRAVLPMHRWLSKILPNTYERMSPYSIGVVLGFLLAGEVGERLKREVANA